MGFGVRRLSESRSRGLDSLLMGAVVEDHGRDIHEHDLDDQTLTMRTETDFELKYSQTLTIGSPTELELPPMDAQAARLKQVLCRRSL